MRYNSILDTIGRTPLVQTHRIFSHLPIKVWLKCEFFNPAGSIKDRIALNMVRTAEKMGKIAPGDTLIEASSGNTGIGLAFIGAVLGYNVIITMPEKMSHEKEVLIKALGAKIIRTPDNVPSNSPEGHVGLAKKLAKQIPRALLLDQYSNMANRLAHETVTSSEILEDLRKCPDCVIAGAGTGGTITGLGKAFKKVNPSCYVVGVDPEGSAISGKSKNIKPFRVEGIGYDFVPPLLEHDVVDEWVLTTDHDSFFWSRLAIRREGILCGGSSGAALSAVEKVAERLPKGSDVVVILADGVRNYMSKHLDDEWCDEVLGEDLQSYDFCHKSTEQLS